jgi:fatty acid desaturase
MSDDPHSSKGFVFFSDDVSTTHKRRRSTFVVILLAAVLALIWPVYPFFSGIHPLVLDLPFSLVWVVLWLFIMFGALVWLYRAEEIDSPAAEDEFPG